MTKFAIYYGVTPKGDKKLIKLEGRGELSNLKKKCKEDVYKLGGKYTHIVLATDYGVVCCFKTVKPKKEEEPKED